MDDTEVAILESYSCLLVSETIFRMFTASFVFQNMLWWHGPNRVRSIVLFKYCSSYDVFILITVIILSIMSSAWYSYKQWRSAWPGICPLYVLFSAYRCPLCMHSAWNMEHNWEQMDKEISQSPMPTEYQDATVKVWHMYSLWMWNGTLKSKTWWPQFLWSLVFWGTVTTLIWYRFTLALFYDSL